MTTPESTLHPRLTEIVNYLSLAREQVVSYVATVPATLESARPAPSAWSVAETLEHLAIMDEMMNRMVPKLGAQVLDAGGARDGETSSMLGSLDAWDPVAGNFKLVAPDRVAPAGGRSVADSLGRLEKSREELLEHIRALDGLDLTRAAVPHPYFGPLHGYQWLVLLGHHELRHLRQMQQTVQQLQSSAAPSPTATPGFPT